MNGTEGCQGLTVSCTKIPVLSRYFVVQLSRTQQSNKKIDDRSMIFLRGGEALPTHSMTDCNPIIGRIERLFESRFATLIGLFI